MTDFATLKVRVDALEAKVAGGELDDLTNAGGRAEKSMFTLSNAAKVAGAALAAMGIGNLVDGVIEANRSYQSLSASLKVATGSVEAASAEYAKLQKFAAETPFAVEQSVNAFLKLKNLGLDPSTEAMRSYGNTAASMGKDLMQMIEAVADATTGEFERLKEFGIKASQAGDQVSFTFQGVTTTVGKSAAEIEKYLQNIGKVQFAGAMDEQMKTLNGQFANLEDSVAALYVAIGKLGANSALTQMLEAATTAVGFLSDNLDTIVTVLGAGAIAFGTYKAAMLASVAVNALMSGSLGLIAATVATTTTQFGVMAGAQVTMAAASAGATTALRGLTAAMIANPATAVAVAIAALAAGLYVLSQRADEASAAQERHAQQTRTLTMVSEALSGELATVASATGAARDQAIARAQALKAQAEEALRTARAEATLAAVTAARKAQEAQADIASIGMGSNARKSIFGTTIFGKMQSASQRAAEQAQQEAFKAGEAWREAEQKVASFDRMIEQATKPITLAATATGNLGKATSRAGKEMSDAAKKAEEWAKALEQVRMGVVTGLNEQLGDIDKWIAAWESAADKDFQATMDGIREKDVADKRRRDAAETWARMNRNRTLDTAYEVADIIGGRLGDAVADIAEAFDKLNPDGSSGFGQFLKTTKLFGKTLEDVFKGIGAGVKIGSAVDGIFDAIGIKSSKTGAQIGGAIGQFGGPLGAIAGSIVGGIIGGMLKSTPRASATISVIAGEAMETAIKGSSGKLKEAAGQMANSVIAGLTDLATQLGAELTGNASVSVGMRNGKYRVDTSGSGITKTSKGAIDFGKDGQAAALAFALQDAIKDGVLGGLSASLEKLITGDGDLQVQLQKALSFKSVFDDLAKRDDPAKWAQDEITKWHDGMAKIFAEAGATADELAELERLTGLKRADAASEAMKAIEEAEKAAQDRTREIRDKNIELLQAQGKIEEAEAMARQARIDDAPEYLRTIQQSIEAAKLLADAEAKLADRRALAKTNAQEDFALQQRLYAAQGNDAMVLRLQRENELREATSETTRTQLLAIYAAEGLATATAATAAAQEAAAAKQKAIADEIGGLNRQWLELIGDTQTLRDMDLAALKSDEARDIQKNIWAYQDALEAQKATQEAATAAQEAATKAIEEYNKRLDEARSTLVSAYERESGALQQTIDKFRDFSAGIKEFRDGLIGTNNPVLGLARAMATFTNTSRMAGLGNEASLSSFTGDAQAYLDAARSSGTFEQYQRAMASVLAGSNSAMQGADGVANMAQRQLDQMTQIATGLGLLREQDKTFNEALVDYNKVLSEEAIPMFTETVSTSIDALATTIQSESEKDRGQAADIKILQEQQTITMNRLERLLSRLERDGALAVTLDGESITIGNTTASPVPVDQVP